MMTEVEKGGIYFLSLELENVRCFKKKQVLDLSDNEDKNRPAQWTVILGNNGTGKTTLLDALVTGMQVDVSEYQAMQKIKTDKSDIYLTVAYGASFSDIKKFDSYRFNSIKFNAEEDINAPAYLKNRHIFHVAYSANRKLLSSQNDLLNSETWLKDTYLFSEAKLQFKERFNSVKTTLVNLLPDVAEIDIYYPDENKPELKIRFLANGIWLSLNDLSLGYQSMIAWIVDLAARLFNFYPESKNPIAEPAVVLIDEIDLHLHPKWQREIMRYLSERFINTQFIVTAHSPLIVQAAEDENANIVVLRREGDEVIIDQQPKAIHGWRVDQLLASDLFGLEGSRSNKYEQLLKERRAILGKSKLTAQDKKELKRLELEMGDIPTAETPEDIKAMDIIRRAAKLLEAEND